MNLSPLPIQKFFDNAGRPLSGGKLFTYVPASTTKIATYQDQAGTLNTNPIILSFRGEANIWLDITKTYKFVLAPSTDTDPPTNPIWTVDNIAGALVQADITQQFLGRIIYPQTPSEAANLVTPVNYIIPPYQPARYGAIADSGATDNSIPLANWLKSIPLDGTGFIPTTTGYYGYTTALTRTTRCSIAGEGQGSRLNYTGAGVALTLNEGRFCSLYQFYITGTAAGAGGIYVRNAQEGFSTRDLFVDTFTNGYAMRVSDSWDMTIDAGALRQSGTGLLLDSTNLGQGGVVNVTNIVGVDFSANALGVDYQSGNSANLRGNDFSDCTVAIEVGRAQTGTVFVGCINITDGNWFEGTGAGIRVGRGNTAASVPRDVWIAGNYFGNSGDQIRFYVGTRLGWGRNQWGSGACIIDAGITQTLVMDRGVTVTDNSTAGQTTTIAYDTINIPDIVLRGSMSFSGVITPTQLTANTNDYNPTSLGTANVVRVSSNAPINLTGIVPPRNFCGQWWLNVGGSAITLPHESGLSSAANRFNFAAGNNIVLNRTGMVFLYYDQPSSRWFGSLAT